MDMIQALALAGQAGDAQQQPQGMLYLVVMIGMIFLVFYILIVAPQKKEQKRQDAIRDAVKKGDRVVTIGGIHGTVVAVDTTRGVISVQVDRNVKIDFSKAAIATVITKDDGKDDGAKNEG